MTDLAAPAARPPFWRDVRILRVLGQAGFVIGIAFVLRELFLNLQFNLERQGQDLSFGFLEQRAGFDIKEGLIPYSPNSSFWRALRVGLSNTLKAAIAGIILASVLGLIMGVARLSRNWLIRRVAQVYVEVFRNAPVAVQLVFWYVAVILALPPIGGGLSLFGVAFLSNRAAAIPWYHMNDSFGTWALFILAAAVATWLVRRWRHRVFDQTGRPAHPFLWGMGTFFLVAAVGYIVAGTPISLDAPEFTGRGYAGGVQMSPEFAAILIALVVYTGAFIAEIVRGSILAVQKGQKEAAEALGLTPTQQLRHVVLPQAMRIAIPPLNSQYLNLTKNTSLGLLVGFPDIVAVSRTIANQAGRATQVLLIIMLTYLILSLTISFLMNLLNRRVAYRGTRR